MKEIRLISVHCKKNQGGEGSLITGDVDGKHFLRLLCQHLRRCQVPAGTRSIKLDVIIHPVVPQ